MAELRKAFAAAVATAVLATGAMQVQAAPTTPTSGADATLMQFLHSNKMDQVSFVNPQATGNNEPDENMSAFFRGGKYQLTGEQADAATLLGQKIIDMAKQQGVDLKKFPEVQAAMGYDKSGTLSAAELGAFMVGVAMQNTTALSTFGKVESRLFDSFQLPDKASNLAVQLGQQVYGDTNPGKSAVNTQTGETIAKIKTDPSLTRYR